MAVAQYQAAVASAAAGSKPEYAVVWAGKNNVADMSGNDWMRFVNQGSISPTGLLNVGSKQWLPGLDAMVVLDVRRTNVDTAGSSTSSRSRRPSAWRASRTTCSTSGSPASRSWPATSSPT